MDVSWGCGMCHVVTNAWLQRERIGVISFVQMRMQFVHHKLQIRQTESVHVAIQNAYAHKSDKKFQ